MATSNKFIPGKQVAAFRRLQNLGLISDLSHRIGLRRTHYWTFRMGEMAFLMDGKTLDLDFRQYRMKVVYSTKTAPRVFITTPVLPEKTIHTYRDKSLCLYKESNWQWQDELQFDEDLFPNVCGWIYYYEVWQSTGIWYGKEAVHDPPPELLTKILNHGSRARH